MWVFTRDGFFSVIQDKHCRNEEIMVRARCRSDLCRLAIKLQGYCDDDSILEIAHADYRYRLKMNKTLWADYLHRQALDINYPNVKNSMMFQDDLTRKEAFFSVWRTLRTWQDKLEEDRAKQSLSGNNTFRGHPGGGRGPGSTGSTGSNRQ